MRREDWVERLDAALKAASERPFSYGDHDCCLFVGDMIEAMTGDHPVADARGSYATRDGAIKFLRDRFQSVEGMARSILGDPIDKAFARRGDVALVEQGDAFALGLVDLTGEHIVFLDERGLRRLPKRAAHLFWSVA